MQRDDITLAIAILGAFGGVIGTVLGIANFWSSRRRDQERLRVIPSCYADPSAPPTIRIEIINHGMIDVSVREIGFELRGKRGAKMILTTPMFQDGGAMPKPLAPRKRTCVIFPYSENHDSLYGKIKKAYVQTETGAMFFGTSKALRAWVRNVRWRHRA